MGLKCGTTLLSRKQGKPLAGASLEKVMKELDTDGSGEVDFKEFSEWWPKYCARLTSSRNRSGFDGILGELAGEVAEEQSKGDRKSFNAQLYKIIKFFDGKDASELQAEFKELDADGSGILEIHEFCLEGIKRVGIQGRNGPRASGFIGWCTS